LDQKGSEQRLVDTYGQMVNTAAMNQLRQVFSVSGMFLFTFLLESGQKKPNRHEDGIAYIRN